MSIAEKIVELQNSLDGAPAPVAAAIEAEIKRLTREQNVNAKRVYHDVHNGDLRPGDVLFAYEHRPHYKEQPERFQVLVIEAVSPDGKRYATNKGYNGRPDYEEGAVVWSEDGHVNRGRSVKNGLYRKTKQAAWEAWGANAASRAIERVDAARTNLAKCEAEAEDLLAFITPEKNLVGIPEAKR